MKYLPHNSRTLIALGALVFLTSQLPTALAQGTAFTYQGRLNNLNLGSPANGNYDFRFRLAVDPNGNTYVNVNAVLATNVPVSNGLFLATLDFGTNVFTGDNLWLQIEVKTNGAAGYALLAPLQAVTPTPYAMFANTASNLSGALPAAQLSGTVPGGALAGLYSGAVTFSSPSNSFSGDGAGLTNLNDWKLNGNSGTSPANGNFLGTADNQPLELRVNGLRAMRYEVGSNTNGAPNVVGGSPANFVLSGVIGAVIAGGGGTNLPQYSLGTPTNSVNSDFGVVGGGKGNQIQTNAIFATIAAGFLNSIQSGANSSAIGGGNRNQITNATQATIAGGFLNVIQSGANQSAIGGGARNVASGRTAVIGGGGYNGFVTAGNTNAGDAATIGGGVGNQILAGTRDATIGGGFQNTIQGSAIASTIAGGSLNNISGIGSFIGGGGYDGNNVFGNTIAANDAVIGGGQGNQILGGANSRLSVVGGGYFNLIQTAGADGVICGGGNNVLSGAGAFIGGGGWDGSTVAGNTNAGAAAVIVGGQGNQILSGFNSRLSVIGGGWFNKIQSGGVSAMIGGGSYNVASGAGSFIGGGGWDGNTDGGNTNAGNAAVIGGGHLNQIQGGANYSTIGGGSNNTITVLTISSVIGGGAQNRIQTNAGNSTISGGRQNQIQANASNSSIGGGSSNIVSGVFGTIPGGDQNTATTNSFAAGHRAKAVDQGTFVWADSTDADFSDFGTNTFNVRAAGGVIFTNGNGLAVSWSPAAGSWTFTSDRNAKENFKPLDTQKVLEKVARLPLAEWSYKGYAERHVGPMAQDFHTLFPLNDNDNMLNSADEAGITLAALQGLNEKVEARSQNSEDRIQKLEAQNTELKQRLEKLETLLTRNLDAVGK